MGTATGERAQRAQNAYVRYLSNIRNTNSYQKSLAKATDIFDPSDTAEIMNKAQGRKYSQNTYMGISNG